MSCPQSQSAFKLWALVLGRPALSHRFASQILPFPLASLPLVFFLPFFLPHLDLPVINLTFCFVFCSSLLPSLSLSVPFRRRLPPLVASPCRFGTAHSLTLLWPLVLVCFRDIRLLVISHLTHSLAISRKFSHTLSICPHLAVKNTYNLILHCIQPKKGNTNLKEGKKKTLPKTRIREKIPDPVHQQPQPVFITQVATSLIIIVISSSSSI